MAVMTADVAKMADGQTLNCGFCDFGVFRRNSISARFACVTAEISKFLVYVKGRAEMGPS